MLVFISTLINNINQFERFIFFDKKRFKDLRLFYNPTNLKMNKQIILLLLFFLSIASAQGQEEKDKVRKKYVNFSFVNTKIKQDELFELKSNYGASFSVGRTFFLHKQPVAGLFRFGIDATWLDLNYTSYKVEYPGYMYNETYNYHQVEIGMQVGPSFTLNPVGKLSIQGHFRYAPSFSALYMDETIFGNYATFFVAGGSVSYRAIGLGVEARWGNCKYKDFFGESDDEYEYEDTETTTNLKVVNRGFRAYLTLRF